MTYNISYSKISIIYIHKFIFYKIYVRYKTQEVIRQLRVHELPKTTTTTIEKKII